MIVRLFADASCLSYMEENRSKTSKFPRQTEVQMVYNPPFTGQDMSSARGQFTYQLKEYVAEICVKYRMHFFSIAYFRDLL